VNARRSTVCYMAGHHRSSLDCCAEGRTAIRAGSPVCHRKLRSEGLETTAKVSASRIQTIEILVSAQHLRDSRASGRAGLVSTSVVCGLRCDKSSHWRHAVSRLDPKLLMDSELEARRQSRLPNKERATEGAAQPGTCIQPAEEDDISPTRGVPCSILEPPVNCVTPKHHGNPFRAICAVLPRCVGSDLCVWPWVRLGAAWYR
jgi:hypothetical protein